MIEPIDFGGALRRSWRLLLVCAVVFAIVGVLVPVGHAKPKEGKNKLRYQASAVVGSQGGSGNTKSNITNILFWANEYTVKQQAVADSGLPDNGTLEPNMTATVTVLGGGSAARPGKAPRVTAQSTITLAAGGTTAQSAAQLANAYALALSAKAQEAADAQAQAAQNAANAKSGGSSTPSNATGSSGFQLLTPATGATRTGGAASSLGSSRKVRGLAGVVIGLLVGAAIVLAREVLDKRIHTAGRAERTFKYPVVVEISDRLGINGEAHSATVLEVVDAPTSAAAEAYRMLRMSVIFEELAAGPPVVDAFNEGLGVWQDDRREEYKVPEPGSRQVILVVSAAEEESRPKVAANLSATYAEAGQHVIVISTGDVMSGYVGPLANGTAPGVSDVDAHLVPSHLPNVSRLSLRPFVGNGGQLVTHAPAVLQATRQLADVTILESPPLLRSHHAEALVHAVDVVLVVGECAQTTMSEARKAGELLRRLGAPVLGVVLTKVRPTPRELRRAARLARTNRSKRGQPSEPERALVDPQVVPEISPPVWESSQA